MSSEVTMSSSSPPARSKACQQEPVAIPCFPELSVPSIDTDVRWRGFNPLLTGVTVGILAFITGFLFVFAYLVETYLR
jgi:hypothetical protein